MIRVVYHREYNRLTMEGHAQSGEPGHDLVCAAASMLAYTLAANVKALEKTGQATDMIADLREGKAEVSCKAHYRMKAIVTMIFDAVCMGFSLLARDEAEYITYEVRG